jgi:hypothetical protein
MPIGQPFMNWVVDHCGPFPASKPKGKKYILNMIDRFTKIPELAATKSTNMEEAARKFEKRVVKRWGTPKTVLGDDAFKGKFAEMCELRKIRLINSLPLQKGTVGLVERRNRLVEEKLRALVSGDFSNWPSCLPDVQFSIFSGVTRTHGFSPARVGIGVEPRMPVENILDPPEPVEDDVTITEVQEAEFAVQSEQALDIIQDTAEINLEKTQAQMKTQYDSSHNLGSYEVDEWVSVKRHETDTKLDHQRMGPYRVVRYDLNRLPNVVLAFGGLPGTEVTFHQNELLPWPGLSGDLEPDKFPQVEFKVPRNISYGLARQLREVRDHHKLNDNSEVRLQHILGQRISVKWAQRKGEWYNGTVVAHEGKGQFWVLYENSELTDSDGSLFQLEKLLSGRPPPWKYIKAEDDLVSEEGGVVDASPPSNICALHLPFQVF